MIVPKKAQFVHVEIDVYSQMVQAASLYTRGLSGLQKKQDFNAVQQFRDRNEGIFSQFDKKMTVLCSEHPEALIDWASRMGMVRNYLNELDRSLAFRGQRQFDWAEVLRVMGLLNALHEATKLTIYLCEAQ